MGKGLGERSGEVGVTEGGLEGEEQCDKETERERERARARPRETANLAVTKLDPAALRHGTRLRCGGGKHQSKVSEIYYRHKTVFMDGPTSRSSRVTGLHRASTGPRYRSCESLTESPCFETMQHWKSANCSSASSSIVSV